MRVVALPPDHLRQHPAAGVDEPVADLQHRQVGLARQGQLLGVGRVRVVAVVVQPLAQDLDRLLGEVAAALAGVRRPRPGRVRGRVVLRGALLVRRGARVAFALAD